METIVIDNFEGINTKKYPRTAFHRKLYHKKSLAAEWQRWQHSCYCLSYVVHRELQRNN